MSNRIPDDAMKAAGFDGSQDPVPTRAKLVRVIVYGPTGESQVLEGAAALVGVLLGQSGPDQTAGAQWFANLDHMSSAMILANLIAWVRQQFGQRAIDAAMELSTTTEMRPIDPKPDNDATGGA